MTWLLLMSKIVSLWLARSIIFAVDTATAPGWVCSITPDSKTLDISTTVKNVADVRAVDAPLFGWELRWALSVSVDPHYTLCIWRKPRATRSPCDGGEVRKGL